MHPDRPVMGQSRGHEALDMLQALNTGHNGGMPPLHSNDSRDSIPIPLWMIRRPIAAAVHPVVQAARLTPGVRRVTTFRNSPGWKGTTSGSSTTAFSGRTVLRVKIVPAASFSKRTFARSDSKHCNPWERIFPDPCSTDGSC
ncbi:MAG TPA: hypothetical protein DDY91_23665 [Planctomycetaceae bacterium]|nr:hypothetical protein [Planctomycetaceae bacterium]